MAEAKKKGEVALIVRPGRTVTTGEARTRKNEQGNEVAAAPATKNYGPGDGLTLPADEAERLIAEGAVVRAGTPEARAAKQISNTIPANFPHADELAQHGIETFDVLSETADIADLKGIGAKKAEAIQKALDERQAAATKPK